MHKFIVVVKLLVLRVSQNYSRPFLFQQEDIKSPAPEDEKEIMIHALLIEEKKILRDSSTYLSSRLNK